MTHVYNDLVTKPQDDHSAVASLVRSVAVADHRMVEPSQDDVLMEQGPHPQGHN